MPLPGVSITIAGGGLGRTAPADDRVMGLLVHGITADATERVPKVFYGYDAAAAFIQTLQTGEASLKVVIQEQLRDFYGQAGEGAELWLLLCASSRTVVQLFDAGSTTCEGRVLMEAAGGRISVMGYARQKANANVAQGIGDEVVSGLLATHLWAQQMASLNMPCRVVLDGSGFTGDPVLLPNLTIQQCNRVSIVLGRTTSAVAGPQGACVGLLLGRLAKIPPQQNVGWPQLGPVASEAFLTSATTSLRSVSQAVLGAIHDKGYIVLRWLMGRGGYYFSSNPTATSLTDDFRSLSNGRIIDKVQRILYQTYLDDLLGNVTIDRNTGKILETNLKYYEGKADQALRVQLQSAGQISWGQTYVDPQQDVLATGVLTIVVQVVPVGTTESINITLGLKNPLNR